MSILKTNAAQIGLSGTATNNFTIYQPVTPDGTVRVGVGNADNVLADVVAINSAGLAVNTTSSGYKLEIYAGDLASAAGSKLNLIKLRSDVTNSSQLQFDAIRTSTGGGYETAANRIQQVVDVTKMGYVQFNGTGNQYGISFGIDEVETARFTQGGSFCVGGLTDSGSKVGILKNNPSGFNNAHLELVSSTGDVILGFHASGSTAVCIDHLRGTTYIRCLNGGRSAYTPILASQFAVNSDYRLKENLQPLTGAIERIKQLPVHRFSFIENSMMYREGELVDGFLAHEVQTVVPEAVLGEKDEMNDEGNPSYQSIDQSKIVPLLTAALQELSAKVDALQSEVNTLKSN